MREGEVPHAGRVGAACACRYASFSSSNSLLPRRELSWPGLLASTKLTGKRTAGFTARTFRGDGPDLPMPRRGGRVLHRRGSGPFPGQILLPPTKLAKPTALGQGDFPSNINPTKSSKQRQPSS